MRNRLKIAFDVLSGEYLEMTGMYVKTLREENFLIDFSREMTSAALN